MEATTRVAHSVYPQAARRKRDMEPFVIEKGIPLPPKVSGPKGPRPHRVGYGYYKSFLASLEVGDSFLVPKEFESAMVAMLPRYRIELDRVFSQRVIDGRMRVWRVG